MTGPHGTPLGWVGGGGSPPPPPLPGAAGPAVTASDTPPERRPPPWRGAYIWWPDPGPELSEPIGPAPGCADQQQVTRRGSDENRRPQRAVTATEAAGHYR